MSSAASRSPKGILTGEKHKRRANSCIPCRESKSRCTGGLPCSTCQKKRHKPECVYRNMTARDGEEAEESSDSDHKTALSRGLTQEPYDNDDEDEDVDRAEKQTRPLQFFFGSFSLSRSVDEFKLLLPTEGLVHEIISPIHATDVFQGFSLERTTAEETESIPKQDLTKDVDAGSLIHENSVDRMSEGLRRLRSKVISVRQLLQSGRAFQAWIELAGLVRTAELYGLNQDQAPDHKASEARDAEDRRRLWWQILDLDIQLSYLLGRPPMVPCASDIPRPRFDGLRHDYRQLRENQLDFTQYLIDVLGSVMTAEPGENGTTTEKNASLQRELARLERLQTRVQQLSQQRKKEVDLSIAIADHQLAVHLFSLVLYCRIARSATRETATTSSHSHSTGSTSSNERRSQPPLTPARPHGLRSLRKHTSYSKQKEILQSARDILDALKYIQSLEAAQNGYHWIRCFAAFCAASILAIARLRQEVDLEADDSRIRQVLRLFQDLSARFPDSSLAQLATTRLNELIGALNDLYAHTATEMYADTHPAFNLPPTNFRHEPDASLATARRLNDMLSAADETQRLYRKRPGVPPEYHSTAQGNKRQRLGVIPPIYENQVAVNPAGWHAQHDPSYAEMTNPSSHDPASQQSSYHQQSSFSTTASVSFTANEGMDFANMRFAAVHADGGSQIYNASWLHPPMEWHPPLYPPGWNSGDATYAMVPMESAQHSFYGAPATMSMGQPPHPLEAGLNSNPPVHMNPAVPTSSPHENMTMGEAPATASRHPRTDQTSGGQQESEFYSAPADAFIRTGHVVRGDGMFADPTDTMTRRSLGGIRPPQRTTWTVETPADYTDQRPRSNQKLGAQDRSQLTPPGDGIWSPTGGADAQSRRNSVTARQILRTGRPNLLPKPSEGAATDQGHQLAAQQMENEELGSGRRHSVIHHQGHLIMTDAGHPSVEPHQQQSWLNPPTQLHYDTTSQMPFGMTMQDQSATYDTHYHQNQTPRQVLTSGPYLEQGQSWWAG